jgi:hypothetical protein
MGEDGAIGESHATTMPRLAIIAPHTCGWHPKIQEGEGLYDRWSASAVAANREMLQAGLTNQPRRTGPHRGKAPATTFS